MANDAERDREKLSKSYSQKNRPDEVTLINEGRRMALDRIDNARFSWVHIKICLVVGVGLFTEAYETFAIAIIASMLGYVSGDKNGDLSAWQSTGLKAATPVGCLIGQVVFGCLADTFGRRKIYGAQLVLVVTATFGQALAGPGEVVTVVGVLIVWRFIMGIGNGGGLPLSAIIMSEFAPIQSRGRLMTAVFAFQGWGQLAAGLVGMIVVAAYGDAIRSADYPSAQPIDYIWRILVGLGCVSGLIAYCVRFTIPESPRFTMDIERNITRATRDIKKTLNPRNLADHAAEDQYIMVTRASLADLTMYFSKWTNLRALVGIAYSKFALDVPFYCLILNSSAILTYSDLGKISGHSSDDVYQSLIRICGGCVILVVAGFIPGFWMSYLFIDSWGRKSIQLIGFIMLTALFLIMAFAYIPLNSTVHGQRIFIVLYCFANFFLNFGPNTTTFIIPGEMFPTRYRSTVYGICAACGTVGAIVAQLGFGWLLNKVEDMQIVLEVLSFIMSTGVMSTLLIPETKDRSLEDLSNESQLSYVTGVLERGVPSGRF